MKAPLTEGFCADFWDSKEFLVSRPERTKGLINAEQRWKIWWKRAIETTESESCELVFCSEFNR